MTKSKNTKKSGFIMMGPAAPDDPIYRSGYVMLRPIRGKAKRSRGEAEEATKAPESKRR